MSTVDYTRAVDLRPVPGSRLPAGRDVDQGELAALLAACAAHGGPAGTRDAAVISLAYLSGTRRAELAALHMADVELDPPCGHGERAMSAVSVLATRGRTDVAVLVGGPGDVVAARSQRLVE